MPKPLDRTAEDISQDERISSIESNLIEVHKRLEVLEAKPKVDDRLAAVEAVIGTVKRLLRIRDV